MAAIPPAMKKTLASKTKKPAVKVGDLKPKADPKGGRTRPANTQRTRPADTDGILQGDGG